MKFAILTIMNTPGKKFRITEVSLVSLMWLVLLLTPVLFSDDAGPGYARTLKNQLEILVPVAAVFLINRLFLVPFLIFRGRRYLYFTAVIGTIALFTLGLYLYDLKIQRLPVAEAPSGGGDYSWAPSPGKKPDRAADRPVSRSRPPRPMPPFGNLLIMSILVVGFDTGLRSGLKWVNAENEKVRLEKENMSAQLVLLRNQVSPHFFMNTLNNIHSLADVDVEAAKEAIISLSKMMRYLLYETQNDKTTLAKEVEFLSNYIDLMRMRYTEKVRISLALPMVIPDKTLPPFLFTSLIENAFKHGISYLDHSFVDIDLWLGESELALTIRNSCSGSRHREASQGIGIQNTRKRLDLLYGRNYRLDISDCTDLFTVKLTIPI